MEQKNQMEINRQAPENDPREKSFPKEQIPQARKTIVKEKVRKSNGITYGALCSQSDS